MTKAGQTNMARRETRDADRAARRSGWRMCLAAGLLLMITLIPQATRVAASAGGTWIPTAPMSTPHMYHRARILRDGRVLVVGGQTDPLGNYIESVEIYDPAAGTWSLTGSLDRYYSDETATVLSSGKVLVAGESGAVGAADLYDPTSGTWLPTGFMSSSRTGDTATLLPDGKVLVAGGLTNSFGNWLDNSESYDPATGRWTTTAGDIMMVRRYGHSATLLQNGKVLVAGGTSNGLNTTDSAEIYDGFWTTTGSMFTARTGQVAVLLPSGKVLVAGGKGGGLGNSPVLASAELYDPISGAWSPASSMATPRTEARATLLLDGRVLVEGGNDSATDLASAEIYDPGSNTWTPTGAMNTPRADHTATLLPNGNVLATGGNGLTSAEIYQGPPPPGTSNNTWPTVVFVALLALAAIVIYRRGPTTQPATPPPGPTPGSSGSADDTTEATN